MSNKNLSNRLYIYETPDGRSKIRVNFEQETCWLTQSEIAALFGVDRSVISKHIQNIFRDSELEENSTHAKIAQVQNEGGRKARREVDSYNLDLIIAVGYRVSSIVATSFRRWATERLKEYIIKGFALDDDRLKEGSAKKDYFDELEERVRIIRTSERNMFEKVRDIFTTSVDYISSSDYAKKFYFMVQNKFEYAIVGLTSEEIVVNRISDDYEDFYGLKS